jgi:RNA polymerase sigma-70 factor (sigma-E family)
MTTERADPLGEDYRSFVQRRAAPLHRTAYLLCGDWHVANDLVQETLAKAFRHWRRVRRADNPDAYVHRMLINEANQHWRRHRKVVPFVAGVHDPSIPDVSEQIVERSALLRALLALPPRQRATVVLRYLADMSERETAEVLQCSLGTVKSQTSRALDTLKTFLDRTELYG